MARVTAERPFHAPHFAQAVHSSMPKATSLQLTVSVTTKLARLLQEQAGREIAVNRIATAIRSSLELPSILQTTVNEVGRALRVQSCVMRIEGETETAPLVKCYVEGGADSSELQTAEVGDEEGAEGAEVRPAGHFRDWYAYSRRLVARSQNYLLDGRSSGALGAEQRPLAIVPMVYHERFVGALMVRSADATRLWEETEVLLLRTVADQVAVAVNHARLFAQVQQQALTDALTGCFNRRSFEMQLEREVRIAMRQRQPLSVVLLDIDHFKRVNDTYGHDAGDAALRYVAGMLREELRGVDTAARYGGEEFVVVLPQAGTEGAVVVAERLRERLAGMEVPGVGRITASFGVATYPLHGRGREEMVKAADRALYEAKAGGRNQVRVAESVEQEVTDAMFDRGEEDAMWEDDPDDRMSMPDSLCAPLQSTSAPSFAPSSDDEEALCIIEQ